MSNYIHSLHCKDNFNLAMVHPNLWHTFRFTFVSFKKTNTVTFFSASGLSGRFFWTDLSFRLTFEFNNPEICPFLLCNSKYIDIESIYIQPDNLIDFQMDLLFEILRCCKTKMFPLLNQKPSVHFPLPHPFSSILFWGVSGGTAVYIICY